jgi:ankyrin repeat protein
MADDYNEYQKRIKNFADLNVALFRATTQGDLRAMEELLDKGAGVDGTCRRDGWSGQESILCAAVKDNRIDAAELLIKRGATVNMIGPDGRTALHVAARHGHDKMVKMLVKNGADRSMGFDSGTVFDLAEKAPVNEYETIHALLEGYGLETLGKTFRDAARRGNVNVLEVISAKEGVDVDSPDHHGDTAVHLVAKSAKDMKDPAATIKKLLELGANVDAVNNYGETPLNALCMERDPSPKAVGALIEGGADILRENLAGLTNYEAAIAANNPAIVPLFEAAYEKRVTAEVGKVYEGAANHMKIKPIRLKKPPAP